MSNPPTDAAQALAERDTAEAHRAAAAADAATSIRLMESAQAERNQLRADNARLLAIIGADTPIAAFSLAATWQAEKAGYMERVEALTLALDEQAHDLAADKARVHEQVMQKLAAEFPDHPWLKKENP